MNFLEFLGVKKSFGKKEVLKGINFFILEGDIFGFSGKSGGGKTTLLNILIGLSKPSSGKILFKGKEISKDYNSFKKKVGFVSQDNSLFLELTLKENCFYFGKLYSMKRKEIHTRFLELVKILDLEEYSNLKLSEYSGGMLRRANILVSLIHHPDLLILDEPTVGLDNLLRESLWDYIKKINKKEKLTIFLVTHLLKEIEENCSSVAIMKGGKIATFARVEEYHKKYTNLSFEEIFKRVMENENI